MKNKSSTFAKDYEYPYFTYNLYLLPIQPIALSVH